MNERERWIVYPLLFLALGVALRDKLVDRTIAKSIVCQELSIVDEESTGQQPQRTLARIGAMKSKPGGKSSALMQVNGYFEIVDGDLTEISAPPFLFRAGRTDPLPSVPSTGYAIVRGEVRVDGLLAAQQYLWQGAPLLPFQLGPGIIVPAIPQALPPSAPKPTGPKAHKTQPPNRAPVGSSKKDDKSTPPSSPADEKSADEK
jgi:hypothetical protein